MRTEKRLQMNFLNKQLNLNQWTSMLKILTTIQPSVNRLQRKHLNPNKEHHQKKLLLFRFKMVQKLCLNKFMKKHNDEMRTSQNLTFNSF